MCSFYTDRVGRKEIRQATGPRNQLETVDDCDIHCSISVPLVVPTRAFPNVILPNLFPNYSALFYYIPPCEWLNVCSIFTKRKLNQWAYHVGCKFMRAIYRWSCKGYIFAYPILGNSDLIFAMLHADTNYHGWVGTLPAYLYLSRALLSRMTINMFFPKKYWMTNFNRNGHHIPEELERLSYRGKHPAFPPCSPHPWIPPFTHE